MSDTKTPQPPYAATLPAPLADKPFDELPPALQQRVLKAAAANG